MWFWLDVVGTYGRAPMTWVHCGSVSWDDSCEQLFQWDYIIVRPD